MKNDFYMGYDASALKEQELLAQAENLLNLGFYSAGYDVLRLGDAGRFENAEALGAKLRSVGFKLDIAIPCAASAEEAEALVKLWQPAMVTLTGAADHEKAEKLMESLNGVRIAVRVEEKDLAWAAEKADVAELDVLTETGDYFDVTRHQLDSCREGDVDTEKSDANLRARAMKDGGVWYPGTLPCRFDYYRNEAIFINMCVLGCPLVLCGDVEKLPAAYAALVKNEKLIRMASLGVGHVARYYDPWHSLLAKAETEKTGFALILNRCHGDQPTNILPADLGWDCRFRLMSWPEGELLGANLETFEAHVETSDHPQTPCCRLYRLEQL